MDLNYQESLPVSRHRADIIKALSNNKVVIVAGETGSGKTTQIPKMCLELLGDSTGIIGCTQPRRVAALTVSQRVAEELGDTGFLVGSKIRFHDRTDEKTRIKFMTDGVLLAETRTDRLLRKYAFLIIDEAHERSLNIDFIIGHVKTLLAHRDDLKVIITSATIDVESFSRHFGDAPVIEIPGKTFPVEVRYSPPSGEEELDNYIEKSVEAAYEILMLEPPGDILIFHPTERDIRSCCELLSRRITDIEILPLFGRLHPNDQKRIFKPSKKTKVVVATNVAETSITVPGIRYVIDTGLARMAYYNFRSKTNSLPIRKVSQASCNQRKGRCGRVGAGVCIRLYDEEDFLGRDQFTLPEIKRSNLAEVVLQMLSYGLGDPYTFPFLDPPQTSAIREGFTSLFELGAVDSQMRLSRTGKMMASLPIDPQIARIIIEAKRNNCLKEVMIIASVLAIQDPRTRPANKEKEADLAHEKFRNEHSDFLTFLKIWDLFHDVKAQTSWSRLKKFCQANYLSFLRMREWFDLHEQMKKILKSHGQFRLNQQDASYEDIHKSLAIGFLRNIGLKKDKNLYQGGGGKEVMIFPGSGQFKTSPQWILASSFLETSRLYAINVAAIQPDWLEKLAGSLCRHSWSNAKYHKKTGQVIASEKVSLFGLVIVASRSVSYGKTNTKNQAEARHIFIQEALVQGNLFGNFPFLQANQKLIKRWGKLENRLRVRDIVVSDQDIFNFYDKHLPPTVFDKASLTKHLKRGNTTTLFMKDEDISQRRVEGHELADYPKKLNFGNHSFPLQYTFDPSSDSDGVTVKIPIELTDVLPAELFEWTVPGFLKEKVTLLLKSLPKRLRKHIIPINLAVDRVLDDIILYQGSLLMALSKSILKNYSVSISRADWSTQLPPHLTIRIILVDGEGKTIATGRDFTLLRKQIVEKTVAHTAPQRIPAKQLEEIKRWEQLHTKIYAFSDLPSTMVLRTSGKAVSGYMYPALIPVAAKNCVSVQFFSRKNEAFRQNRDGLRYLYQLHYLEPHKSLKKFCKTTLSGPSSLWLYSLFSTKAEAVEAVLHFIVDSLFGNHDGPVPGEAEFNEALGKVPKANYYQRGVDILQLLMAFLRTRNEVASEIAHYESLSKKSTPLAQQVFDDFKTVLSDIVPPHFLLSSTVADIPDHERYLKSLAIRVKRAYANFPKDRKKADMIQPFIDQLMIVKKKEDGFSDECKQRVFHLSQMIQEFRISLFSPEIRTKYPVSAKKLQQLLKDLQQNC